MIINTNGLIVSHHLNLFPFLPVWEQVKRNNPANYKSSIQHMKIKPAAEKPGINAIVEAEIDIPFFPYSCVSFT